MSQAALERAGRFSRQVLSSYLHEASAEPQRKSPNIFSGGGAGSLEQIINTALGGEVNDVDSQLYERFRGWLYAAVRPIAQTIAGQPIFVGRLRATPRRRGILPAWMKYSLPDSIKSLLRPGTEDLELLPSHELLDVLHDPNPTQVNWSLLDTTVISLQLTGKAYWWVYEEKGKKQIWTVPSNWMRPIHDSRGFYAAWSCKPPGAPEPFIIPGDQVAYYNYPNPADPLDATSPAQSQRPAIEVDAAIQSSQLANFQNGLFPGMAVIIGDEESIDGTTTRPLLEREDRHALLLAIKMMMQGVMKHGEPLILDALVRDIKKISTSPHEMDWLNSGQQIKSRIMQAIGTNPIIAGELDNANRSSAVAAELHFAKFTVNPIISLMSQVMTAWLGPMFAKSGEKLCVWIEPVEVIDDEARRENILFLVEKGLITRNEGREAFKYPPIPSGDSFWMNLNYAVIKAGDEVAESLDAAQGQDPREGAEDDPNAEDQDEEKPDDEEEEGEEEEKPKDEGKGWQFNRRFTEAMWLKQHQRLENGLSKVLDAYFLWQGKKLAEAYLTASEAVQAAGSVFLLEGTDWDGELDARVRPELARAVAFGLVFQAKLLGQDLPEDMGGWQIRRTVNEILAQGYWHGINQTTADKLAEIFRGEQTFAPQEVAQKIRQITKKRGSGAIARTEITGATNAGHELALSLTDISRRRGWLAVVDSKCRATHAKMDGQLENAEGFFEVAGHLARFPGDWRLPPEERINCRCIALASSSRRA